MMKEQKGITLIALVITIIVLLILAGVSIAMLTSENGILKKAGDAKTDSLNAELEEAIKMAIAEIITNNDGSLPNKDGDNPKGKLTQSDLETALTKANSDLTYSVEPDPASAPTKFTISAKKGGKDIATKYDVAATTGKITEVK